MSDTQGWALVAFVVVAALLAGLLLGSLFTAVKRWLKRLNPVDLVPVVAIANLTVVAALVAALSATGDTMTSVEAITIAPVFVAALAGISSVIWRAHRHLNRATRSGSLT